MGSPIIKNAFEERNVFLDVALGISTAPFTLIDDVIGLGVDVAQSLDLVDESLRYDPIFTVATDTTAGKVAQELTGFLIGFGVVGKGFRGVRWANAARKARAAQKLGKGLGPITLSELGLVNKLTLNTLQGAVTDFVVLDPQAPRLSDLLLRYTSIRGPVVEFLSYDLNADDAPMMGRLKNAMEGAFVGVPIEAAFRMVSSTIRMIRGTARAATPDGEAARHLIEEASGFDLSKVAKSPEWDKLIKTEGGNIIQAKDTWTGATAGAREFAKKLAKKKSILKNPDEWLIESRNVDMRKLDALQRGSIFQTIVKEQGMEKGIRTILRQHNFEDAEFLDIVDELVGVIAKSVEKAKGGNKNFVGVSKELQTQGGLFTFLQGGRPRTFAEVEARVMKIFNGIDDSALGRSMLNNSRAFATDTQNLDIKSAVISMFIEESGKRIHNSLEPFLAKAAAKTLKDSERLQLLELIETHMTVHRNYVDGRRSIARALGVGRLTLKNKTTRYGQATDELLTGATPDQLKAVDDVFTRYGGRKGFERLVKKLSKAPTGKAVHATLTRGQKGPLNALIRAIHENRIANMLGWVRTNAINVIGTSMNLVIRDIWETHLAYHIQDAFLSPGAAGAARSDFILQSETFMRSRAFLSASNDFARNIFRNSSASIKEKGLLTTISDFGTIMDDVAIERLTRLESEGVVGKAISREAVVEEMLRPLFEKFGRGEIADTLMIRIVGNMAEYAGKLKRGPGLGVMHFFDSAFKNMAYTAELEVIAYRNALAAVNVNKLTKTAQRLNPDEFTQYHKNLVDSVMDFNRNGSKALIGLSEAQMADVISINSKALKSAKEGVFQGTLPDELEGFIRTMSSDSPALMMIKSFFMPFMRTPLNLLKAAGERTPILAQITKKGRADILGRNGTEAQARAMARMSSGIMLYGAFGSLVMSRHVTGFHTKDERAAMRAANIPEYSIFIGDRWVAYDRLDPLGIMLGIVADIPKITNAARAGEVEEAIANAIISISENTINKTYMKGIGDILGVIRDPDRYGRHVLKNLIVPTLPTVLPTNFTKGLKDTARQIRANLANDPSMAAMRDTRDFVDNLIEAEGLFLDPLFEAIGIEERGTDTPLRYDVLGRTLNQDTSIIGILGQLTGLRTTMPTKDPAILEMAKLRMFSTDQEPTIMGVQLNREEGREFRKIMGELDSVGVLNQIVSSQAYKQLSNKARFDLLREVQRNLRSAAKNELLLKNPTVRSSILKRYKFKIETLLENADEVLTDPTFRNLIDIIDFDKTSIQFEREE